MLSRFRVAAKLLWGFGLILSLFAVISGTIIFSARKIRSQVELVKNESYHQAVGIVQLVHTAEKALADLRFAAESANIDSVAKGQTKRESFRSQYEKLAGKSLGGDAAGHLKEVGTTFEAAFAAGEKMAEYAAEQDFLAQIPQQKKFDELFSAFNQLAQGLQELANRNLYSELEEINTLSTHTMQTGTMIAIAGIFLGIGLAVAISRDICVPLGRVLAMIRELGKGNLVDRLHLRRQDEIGQIALAMDEMAESLHAMVERLGWAANELTAVSGEISRASARVSDGTQLQAGGIAATSSAVSQISASVREVGRGVDVLTVGSTESTSSILEMASSIEEVALHADDLAQAVEKVGTSITEMATSIRQVAEGAGMLKETSDGSASSIAQMDASILQVERNAKETAAITENVRCDAETGRASVEATIAGIKDIRSAVGMVSEIIATLSARAANIGSILSVIEEITDQTSLLSLNAAIIAAQAGDRGKGFAVVAGEIRELAERTSLSTRQIASVIAGVQEETRRAVEAIAKAEQNVTEGEGLSLQSGARLEQIVAGARQAALQMEQVTRSTREQAEGSRMIRDAVEKTSRMIDQIARATGEQSQGTALIAQAAEKMRDLTLQVKFSTSEQSISGKVVARSMEEINAMVQKIKLACDEQIRGSDQILRATEEIQHSSDVNVEGAKILNACVAGLEKHIALLQKEMGGFQVHRCESA